MKYYVYAIQSEKKNYIYVGMTSNVIKRVREHNVGKTNSTKPYAPFRLIYSEECNSRPEAREKEKEMKSGYKKEWLKRK